MKRALFSLVGITTLALGLSACAEGGSNSKPADTNSITVVTSTSIYGDLVEALAKENADVNVVPILDSTSDDPHEYEATARDVAQIRKADLAVANGGGYDNWLTDHVTEGTPLLTAAELAEGHSHAHGEDGHGEDAHEETGDAQPEQSGSEQKGSAHKGHNHGEAFKEDPHVWLDMHSIDELAEKIAAELHKLDGSIPDDAKAVTERTAKFSDRVSKLDAMNNLITEPVASHLLEGSKLHDVTPSGFATAVAKEAEPSAADIAAAQQAINDGKVDVLITNEQSQTPASQELMSAAKDKKIPVVNINETPDADSDYFQYVDSILKDLESASK